MKIGILSDAHCNFVGTKKCTDFFDSQNVERIIFLGDSVGYLPDPSTTVAHLNKVVSDSLLGNHDAMLARLIEPNPERAAIYNLERNRKQLAPSIIENFKIRRPELTLTIEGKKILFVHGSPLDPLQGYIYPDSPIDTFSELNYDFVFMGHTHRPFIRKTGNMTMVNVGSCGLPRDCGNLASCAIYDSQSESVKIFRLPFDTNALIAEVKDQVHFSVVDCLNRRTNNFFGTKVEVL